MQALLADEHIEGALDLMIDSTFTPLIDQELLTSQIEAALYDNQVFREKPEMWCTEMITDVAFKGNTVGNPWPSADSQLRALTPEKVARFHQTWYRPERVVIAGIGVEHAPFVETVSRVLERYLPSRPSTASTSKLATAFPTAKSAVRALSTTPSLSATATDDVSPLGEPSTVSLASARPRYTGGEVLMEDPNAEFTRLLVAYESVPLHDPDLYPLAVLHTLLGGGSSFSSGGPGKGMYSRFYTDVLVRYASVDHCSALHTMFVDTGLFGVHLAIRNEHAQNASNIMAGALESALVAPKQGVFRRNASVELERAKNQLQMNLLQALESRTVQVCPFSLLMSRAQTWAG